jgi:Leucine-rich repeat (LRR) protein
MRIVSALFLLLVSFQAKSQSGVVEITDIMYGPNWFSDLEKAKQNAEQVYYLDLTLQKLTSFPMEICTAFPNLRHLYIGYNKFTSLPDELGNLTTLEYLDLSGNYLLKKLPEGLKNLTALKKLEIKDMKYMPQSEIDLLRTWLPAAEVVSE